MKWFRGIGTCWCIFKKSENAGERYVMLKDKAAESKKKNVVYEPPVTSGLR